MEINTDNPVSNSLQGPQGAPKANEVKREKEETQGQQTSETKESSDDRVSLSEESRKATSELSDPKGIDQRVTPADFSEAEAAQLSQQVSTHLAQTNASISNLAIQKAVDLFS